MFTPARPERERDLGDHAGAVGHDDAQLARGSAPPSARPSRSFSSARALVPLAQRPRVAARRAARARCRRALDRAVDARDQLLAVGQVDVRPDRAVGAGDAGRVAEARPGRAAGEHRAHVLVRVAPSTPPRVDEHVREHVRQVRDARHHAVVRLGVDRRRLRAERDEQAVQALVEDARTCPWRASGTTSRPRTCPRAPGRPPRPRRPPAGGRRRSARRAPRSATHALGRADVADDARRARVLERLSRRLRERAHGSRDEDHVGAPHGARDVARSRRRSRRARALLSAPARSCRSRSRARPRAHARPARSSPRSAPRPGSRCSSSGAGQARSDLRWTPCPCPRAPRPRAPRRRIRRRSPSGSACGPSQRASSGFGCTSTMIPSAPAAAAASDIARTSPRRPAAWLGSTTTGRCESSLSTGTACRSSVAR